MTGGSRGDKVRQTGNRGCRTGIHQLRLYKPYVSRRNRLHSRESRKSAISLPQADGAPGSVRRLD